MFFRVELNILESWEGYFKAPITGKYRFYLVSDDYSELFLSNQSNSNNNSNLNLIASSPVTTYEAPYYYDTQRSNYISMNAGQFYLMNAFRNQGSGISYMWVGVEIESPTKSAMSTTAVQSIEIKSDFVREIQELRIFNYQQIGKFKIVLESRNLETGYYFKLFF